MATCSLMAALYGCETQSECRKGIYCECNEVYHFRKRDVPATDFQNMQLNELWNYRFKQTPDSTALLNQILKNNKMKEYATALLQDPHIIGDDVKFLLGDEYPQLSQQLQTLVVNAHGMKSELATNGGLEYDNIGDYFSDLFESIKKKVSEKMEACKSKRRILELIRNINNREDLQYILRQILLTGDDKLYQFVSNYLSRRGFSFEEENLYEPRRRFCGQRRGCRRRRRCDGPPGGTWHGRPLKRKVIIVHNNAPIKIDADEDEVIEMVLINELKNAEDNAVTPQTEVTKKSQQVIPPSPPIMGSPSQNFPITMPANTNTNMQSMLPGQVNNIMQDLIPGKGNAYMQETVRPFENMPQQVPLVQNNADLYSMKPPEMNQYERPVMSAPMQGITVMQETAKPQIEMIPDLQESFSSTKPADSISFTTPTNIFQQDLVAPLMSQTPTTQQIQNEILTSPQSGPALTSFIQESIPTISMTNTAPMVHQIEEVLPSPPQMKPISYPSQQNTFMQEALAPIPMNNPTGQIPMMYSNEDISVSSAQMRPTPIIHSNHNNINMQETMGPAINIPYMHQIEEEILPQPPSMIPVVNDVSSSFHPLQGNTYMQETMPSITPDTVSNNLSNISTNDLSQLINQDTIEQNMDYIPEFGTSQVYSSIKPVFGEVENKVSSLPISSTTSFYADQYPEVQPSIISQSINSNIPQTVYEYVSSAPNVASLSYELENLTPPSVSSFNNNVGNISPVTMPLLNDDLEITPLSMPSIINDLEITPPSTPLLNDDMEITPLSMQSILNDNLEITPPSMPLLNDDLKITPPSMQSIINDLGAPSNMENQGSTQVQNAMSNLPSSLSYTNQISSPEDSFSFKMSNLPPSLRTSYAEWMSAPSSFSTMSSNVGNMNPQSSWLTSQISNMVSNDVLPSTSADSGLIMLQESVPSLKESNITFQSDELPSSQILNKSLIHEDVPRYIQHSTSSVSPENSNEELQINVVQNVSESEINGQNIKNEIKEAANNCAVGSALQANNIIQSKQNVEAVSTQPGMAQLISDPNKRRKSLFYLVVDDTGNIVHSANVDHEEEREKAATETTPRFPYISNYFSRTAQNGENNYPLTSAWPYWGK